MIIDMEYKKNSQNDQKSNFLSENIREIYEKISSSKEKYSIYCNITDPRVLCKRTKSQIKTGKKLGISKKKILEEFLKNVFLNLK